MERAGAQRQALKFEVPRHIIMQPSHNVDIPHLIKHGGLIGIILPFPINREFVPQNESRGVCGSSGASRAIDEHESEMQHRGRAGHMTGDVSRCQDVLANSQSRVMPLPG